MPFPETVKFERGTGALLPKSNPVGALVILVVSKMENPKFHVNDFEHDLVEIYLD